MNKVFTPHFYAEKKKCASVNFSKIISVGDEPDVADLSPATLSRQSIGSLSLTDHERRDDAIACF